MRILLTNDDGIKAGGIQTLAKNLSELAEVFVVAPDRERSAAGHSITLRQPLMVKEFYMEDSRVCAYSISGTPADCVKLAIEGQLIPRPDIVISGINQGQNLGTDVLYSGTVSAAIEGALQGVPAIAVSLASYEYGDFTFAASFTSKLCLDLFARGLTKDTLLNVNIPPVAAEEIQDVQITKLGRLKYTNIFEGRVDPRGQKYYWQGGEISCDDFCDPDSDVYAIRQKYISITPIHFDLTNYAIMAELKAWHIKV